MSKHAELYKDRIVIHTPTHDKESQCVKNFDLTTFPNKQAFIRIVRAFNLEYERFQIPRMNLNDYYKYTWSNEDVLLTTGNNPISGRYSSPDQREKEVGYASHISIRGRCDVVEEVAEMVVEEAYRIKGMTIDGRTTL